MPYIDWQALFREPVNQLVEFIIVLGLIGVAYTIIKAGFRKFLRFIFGK